MRWGDTEHLLAGVIDNVRVGNYYTAIAASNRKLTDAPKPPDPMPRPGDKSGKQKRTHGYTSEQLTDVLARWRAGDLEMVDTVTEVHK